MPIVLKSGSFTFLKASGPVQVCTWIALGSLPCSVYISPFGRARDSFFLTLLRRSVCQLGGAAWAPPEYKSGVSPVHQRAVPHNCMKTFIVDSNVNWHFHIECQQLTNKIKLWECSQMTSMQLCSRTFHIMFLATPTQPEDLWPFLWVCVTVFSRLLFPTDRVFGAE